MKSVAPRPLALEQRAAPGVSPTATASIHRIRAAAFAILVVLLVGRPLVTETYEPVEFTFLQALGVSGGNTPALTAALDHLTLLCSTLLICLAPGWSKPAGVALTGLGLAVLFSSLAAGNQRLAINAGTTLLVFSLAGAALACGSWRPAQVHILLAAMFATAVVFALRCVLQVLSEFPDVLAEFERQKAQVPQEQFGPEFVNFERRLRAGQAYGFQAHPNLAASCLLMWTLPLAAVVWAHLASAAQRRTAQGMWLIVAGGASALGMVVAMIYTGSNGALLALCIGALLIVVLQAPRARRMRARTWLRLLCGIYVLGGGALVGYGLYRGTLPGASLAFRWSYWITSLRAWLDSPWTGLGRENLAGPFLRYKPALMTEEIRNAHSLWVTLLAELGPLGLAAGVALAVLALWCAVDHWMRGGPTEAAAPAAGRRHAPLPYVGAIGLGVISLQAWAGEPHFENSGWITLWIAEFVVPWGLAYFLAWRWLRSRADEAPVASAWQAGAVAAVFAALVHNLVDYSLVVPSGLAAFAPMICFWPSGRVEPLTEATRWPSPRIRAAAVMVLMLVLIAHMTIGVIPTAVTQLRLDRFDRQMKSAASPAALEAAIGAWQPVCTADAQDPGIARSLARRLLGAASAMPDRAARSRILAAAEEAAALAARREQQSLATTQLLADVRTLQAQTTANAGERDQLIRKELALRQAACELYPTNPRLRIACATVALHLWRLHRDPALKSIGLENARRALADDQLRPAADAARLTPAERSALERMTSELD